ncbi:acetoacetyl-coenzyme A synthetase [Aureimonas endophytica]|uniref:Acetoacetyl-coenzyme A synthetase n=1 Tax=Aureimonas endophytica TaxID=2027858 RepID=A0A916ZH81_9HYPH|nr:acetoacetate--CoA ligase [Aureimonas endophytica]GGD97356.1 acetoacetyl-coenzyme A synthetase [Aureimonas endophytica]
MNGRVLWTPSPARIARQPLTRFAEAARAATGRELADYAALHAWSIEDRDAFWSHVWDFCEVVGAKGGAALRDEGDMRDARFFPEARLNVAETLLRRCGPEEAIVFRSEDKVERRLSGDELKALVSRLAQGLAAAGVASGDRVAAMLPNMPEAVALMLACASLGAIFSSCSPDFGERGVLDRFGQIEPKLFFACDGYHYAGKVIRVADKLGPISRALKPERTVIVPLIGEAEAVAAGTWNGATLDAFLAPFAPAPLRCEPLPFAHPLFILYSSGTTGVPKCIVHSAGGALLQLMKEHRLHCGITPGARVFYFTTCGWMMWNWLAFALGSGATLLLYDGSPFHPNGNVLFDYLAAERATLFGTSAKFIDAVRKEGLRPIETHDLSAIETITSTGSPLSPEGFDFVYDGIKRDVHLASISGGTDIVSCFVLGVPWLPVHEGEIQGAGLGMAVDVYDDDGRPVRGEKGDLVCTRAFPSMPVAFWNDPGGERYRAAYFERFPNVWCHGDFAEWTGHDGIVIHGRSDATLNPQGVRIGTAEIYNVVESLPEIAEAICVGQDFDGDVRVVLFVRPKPGFDLDEALTRRIRDEIRRNTSPRHVPAKVLAVPDIPRTKSGKIVELAVREVIHGRPVKNKEALANPEALDHFADRAELKD